MSKPKLGISQFIYIALFITSLGFIYPFTVNAFNGDSNQYFSWIKDIYTQHGGYFSWTTAAGYNQLSIIHIFSLLIGAFTYSSPNAFFLIANLCELILLAFSSIMFVKLTNKLSAKHQSRFFYGILLGITSWTLICLFAGSSTLSVPIEATDLFLIFVDSFIILSIGWFIALLDKIQQEKKIPYQQLILFCCYSLYFSLTTLRFINGAILTEFVLLILLLFRGTQIGKTNAWLLGLCLALIFVVGYFGFFCLETYSTSARFVLRGGEVSFTDEWNNAYTAINRFFTFSDVNALTVILRILYLLSLIYGLKVLIAILLPWQKIKAELSITQIFALLTIINFILVSTSGFLSHGTVFIAIDSIAHYYELSAIFSFLTIVSTIIYLDKAINEAFLEKITYIGLIAGTCFSIFYISFSSKTLEFPYRKLSECINQHKSQYNLVNGMGDFWVVNPLMAQAKDNMRFSVIGTMATNLDYNWQRNLSENLSNNNFLVYTNDAYKQNTLALINSKIPHLDYQDIDCGNNSGIIVFTPATTSYIDKFRNQEFKNALSWFSLSNYGFGQTLWAKMPWNTQFVENNHEYNYFGSLFRRISPHAQYAVNSDLSIQVNSGFYSEPVLMTEMIHAGAGKYYLNLDYNLQGNPSGIFVINLVTQEQIAGINLSPATNYAKVDFALEQPQPIALVLVTGANSNFKLEKSTFGKYLN